MKKGLSFPYLVRGPTELAAAQRFWESFPGGCHRMSLMSHKCQHVPPLWHHVGNSRGLRAQPAEVRTGQASPGLDPCLIANSGCLRSSPQIPAPTSCLPRSTCRASQT